MVATGYISEHNVQIRGHTSDLCFCFSQRVLLLQLLRTKKHNAHGIWHNTKSPRPLIQMSGVNASYGFQCVLLSVCIASEQATTEVFMFLPYMWKTLVEFQPPVLVLIYSLKHADLGKKVPERSALSASLPFLCFCVFQIK